MTPTPEATEALATMMTARLAKAMLATMPKVTPDGMARFLLSEGTVLVTVPDVARRLCVHGWDGCWVRLAHAAEAKRLLGVTE